MFPKVIKERDNNEHLRDSIISRHHQNSTLIKVFAQKTKLI